MAEKHAELIVAGSMALLLALLAGPLYVVATDPPPPRIMIPICTGGQIVFVDPAAAAREVETLTPAAALQRQGDESG